MCYNKNHVSNIQILLVIGIVFSPIILFTDIITLGVVNKDESLNLEQENRFNSPQEKWYEYPLDFMIVDQYANGETVIREKRSSQDPSPPLKTSILNSNYTHPLRKTCTPLGGGEEIVLLKNHFTDPIADDLVYIADNKDWISSPPNMTLNGNIINEIGVGPSDYSADHVAEIATGDFDGNYRDDIIYVFKHPMLGSTYNATRIQILENWAGLGFVLMADSKIGDSEIIPTVTAANFDDDGADEFIILAKDQSGPQVWIFDDIIQSTEQGLVFYGNKIMLKTHNSPTSYVYSDSNSANLKKEDIDETVIPKETQFTILKASDIKYRGGVQYGDEIVLRDCEGYYWKVDSQTGEIIAESTVFDESSIFIIQNDRAQNVTSGVVFLKDYVSFHDYRGEIFSSDDMKVHNNGDEYFSYWSKIVNNETLPLNQGFKSIHNITDSDFNKIDILARVDNSMYDFHISPNSITTGNVDGDSQAEIIVTGMDSSGGVKAWVYDDMLNSETIFKELHEFSWTGHINDVTPCVTTGNLDGDIRDEIIFSFTNNGFGQIEIYNDGHPSDPLKYSLLETITGSGDELFGEITRISTGDIDSDGLDEVIFVNEESWLRVWDDSLNNFALFDDWSIPNTVQTENILLEHVGESIPIDHQIPFSLVCGDIDRDGTDEILVSWFLTALGHSEILCGLLSIWDHNDPSFSCICKDLFVYSTMSLRGFPVDIVVGDFNADQFTLRYINHDIYSTEEQLVAVLAAPPTQAGISQNYDASGTNYGLGKSESSSGFVGAHLSFGAYVAVDVDVSIGLLFNLKIAKLEGERALEFEFSYTYTKTTTTAYIATFSGDYDNDYVIFSACLYDLFTYEIVAAPDPYSIGKNYSIHIPNEPDIFKWDLVYYNTHNSFFALDIGSETYNHTIGYIPSYPSEDEMEVIAPDRIEYTGGMQVGKGSGVNMIEIDLSVEVEHEFEFGLTYNWKFGGGTVVKGGLLGSIGGHGGFSIGFGSLTMFSGSVGDIAKDNDYANFRYKFGLCFYQTYVINEKLKDMAKQYIHQMLGIDPMEIELGDSAPSTEDDPYLDSSNKSFTEDELLDAINTVGLEGLQLGTPFYVLNYWVETPEYWGEDAQQVADYFDDVNSVLNNFETTGLTFLSIVFLILPIFIRLRRRHDLEYKKREEK